MCIGVPYSEAELENMGNYPKQYATEHINKTSKVYHVPLINAVRKYDPKLARPRR
jgi:hypothetical protein